MLTTRTGGFPIGFRQGWTEWFKDLSGMLAFAKSENLGVVDLGGHARPHLSQVIGEGFRVGSVDLQAWQGLMPNTPDDLQKTLDTNAEYIAECCRHGAKNFFAVMLPADPGKPRQENLELLIPALNSLGKILDEHGGKLVIEGWPGPGALCCTPESYRQVLSATPKSIGVNFDPSHMIRMGIDPHRFLAEFADRVYHVHGKDCFVDREALQEYGWEQAATSAKSHDFGSAVWRYTIPGYGESNWPLIFSTLEKAGYKGAVSIELEDENFNGTEAGEKLGIRLGASILAAS
jgi:sugar phosphate isomerase/epimerase